MITDSETNLLYLSEKMKERETFWKDMLQILQKHNLECRLLPSTKDIWAVDYMPIQIDLHGFISFSYQPDYLNYKKYERVKTDPTIVCDNINLSITKSDIVLDGGNVIKGKSWVIVTDKIFKENIRLEEKQLVSKLESVLGCRVIVIPREPSDYTGHADGILRYYDDETVLINSYPKHYHPDFQRRLNIALHTAGIKTITIPYNPFNNKTDNEAHGLYINFLQMKDFVLLPSFQLPEDQVNFNLFGELFPNCVIDVIDSRQISKDGGVLSCISWNVVVER